MPGTGNDKPEFKLELTPEVRSVLAVIGLGLSFISGMIGLALAVTAIVEKKQS